MPDSLTEINSNLSQQYKELLPLLVYLKARIKYDTVRWIRTFGAKDELIFSTRIKSFERTFDKIVRAGAELSRNSSLLDIILSNKQLLDDMVGIRFVCFDPQQIIRLISHFVTTERVSISHPEFYRSSKSGESNPIHEFLLASSFSPKMKSGREYEDVSFVFRFTHPIDRFFGSGKIPYTSPGAKSQVHEWTERFNHLRTMFEKLIDEAPQLIGVISKFPIECQIVTATQHIYNRMQRPLYEHVIQKKGNEPAQLYADVTAIEENLDYLKINLLAVDHSILLIHTKMGVQFDFVPKVIPTSQYGIEGRLPADRMLVNDTLREINDKFLPITFSADTNKKRMDALNWIIKLIERINCVVSDRARDNRDIIDHDLLNMYDLAELDHPHIFFWSIQRIVLLVVANILLFSKSDVVKNKLVEIVNAHQVTPDGKAPQVKLAGEKLILERIFEKVKHTDNAIAKALKCPDDIGKWRDGYFSEDIFSDPLVSWRYATFMYKNREYLGAEREILIGLEIWHTLENRQKNGTSSNFMLPEKVLFRRRLVDYQLCHDMTLLQYSSLSLAGILEACNLVTARSGEWIAELDEVHRTTRDVTEKARALCYKLLIRLCVVSAGGLKAGQSLTAALGSYVKQFEEMERDIQENNEIKLKTWWLLCKAATNPLHAENFLATFNTRIKRIKYHPLEKYNFEVLCSKLLRLWLTGPRDEPRGFALNAMDTLTQEIDSLRTVDKLASELQKVREILTQVLSEVRMEKPINEATKDKWRKKLTDVVIDGAEKVVVDTAVAGLRSVLGF